MNRIRADHVHLPPIPGQGDEMTTSADPDLTEQAARYLLYRDPSPSRTRDAWAAGRTASIRTGVSFDALYVSADAVEKAMPGSIRDRDAVEAHLRAVGLTHGVIVPRSRLDYIFVVPPGTSATWVVPRHSVRGRYFGDSVTASPPSRCQPPGAYWILPPPGRREDLCDLERVRDLMKLGVSAIRTVDRSQIGIARNNPRRAE
jgi:hypothetical protein